MHSDVEQQGALARRLRELPEAAALPYGYGEFQRRARERLRSGRSIARGQRLAAAVAIAAGVLAVTLRFDGAAPVPGPHQPALVRAHAQPAPEPVVPALPVRTEVMENWLASLPSEPALVRVGNRAAVTGLEDRIAQLDDLLSAARAARAQPARFATLQQERTRLVGALAQVRYAETLANASR